MNNTRITYTVRLDATPETEISTLANVYRFVLERREAAPRQSRPDDAAVRNTEEVRDVSR